MWFLPIEGRSYLPFGQRELRGPSAAVLFPPSIASKTPYFYILYAV